MIPRLCAHLIHHRGVFGDLRGLKAFLARLEQGRGIGHRVIKPQFVEIIAQIIVIRDILARLRFGIALQPKPKALVGASDFETQETIIDIVIARVNQIKKGLQVRG